MRKKHWKKLAEDKYREVYLLKTKIRVLEDCIRQKDEKIDQLRGEKELEDHMKFVKMKAGHQLDDESIRALAEHRMREEVKKESDINRLKIYEALDQAAHNGDWQIRYEYRTWEVRILFHPDGNINCIACNYDTRDEALLAAYSNLMKNPKKTKEE